jgi:hypothetical protein
MVRRKRETSPKTRPTHLHIKKRLLLSDKTWSKSMKCGEESGIAPTVDLGWRGRDHAAEHRLRVGWGDETASHTYRPEPNRLAVFCRLLERQTARDWNPAYIRPRQNADTVDVCGM